MPPRQRRASHDADETGQRATGFCIAALRAAAKMYSGVAWNNSRRSEVGAEAVRGVKAVELGVDMMIRSYG
jgi:hypothetical protein